MIWRRMVIGFVAGGKGGNPNPSVVEPLLDRGADVHAGSHTPLHRAAEYNNDPAMVELLLDRGADVNAKNRYDWMPLHEALANNENLEVARILVERGADVNGWAEWIDRDILFILRDPIKGDSPLMMAIRRGEMWMIVLLLDHGADPGRALWTAVDKGEKKTVELLLNRGADVDAATNALAHAAMMENPGIVRLLLDAGADPNAKSRRGNTPVHMWTQRSADPEIAALLLDRGADVEARNGDGETPLHRAAGESFLSTADMIALLLDRGADVDATNNNGETPCQLARKQEPLKGTLAQARLCGS